MKITEFRGTILRRFNIVVPGDVFHHHGQVLMKMAARGIDEQTVDPKNAINLENGWRTHVDEDEYVYPYERAKLVLDWSDYETQR
jgi:hypothetical protein